MLTGLVLLVLAALLRLMVKWRGKPGWFAGVCWTLHLLCVVAGVIACLISIAVLMWRYAP